MTIIKNFEVHKTTKLLEFIFNIIDVTAPLMFARSEKDLITFINVK